MKRILPLRDYSEHDVINFFALSTANNSVLDTGNGDNGVIVKVSNGDMVKDAVQYVDSSYLGKTDYPYVGRNGYPEVPLKVAPSASGDASLGITLYETAMYDENGEKLLYYRQKALENQIVLSGQAVPVLTRGTVTLSKYAFESNTVPATNSKLAVRDDGKFGVAGPTEDSVGMILATGTRVSQSATDSYEGGYALVRINFN